MYCSFSTKSVLKDFSKLYFTFPFHLLHLKKKLSSFHSFPLKKLGSYIQVIRYLIVAKTYLVQFSLN